MKAQPKHKSGPKLSPAQLCQALKAFVREHFVPLPEWTDKARKRIKAEVRARWPYYRRSKEYGRLANEQDELFSRLAQVLPSQQPPTDKKKLAAVIEGLCSNSERAFEKYGLACVIPLCFSEKQIMEDQLLSRFFCPYAGLAAWCGVSESPPKNGQPDDLPWQQAMQQGVVEYLTKEVHTEAGYLEKYTILPVELNLYAPKKQILAAVGEIIDAWQTRREKARLAFGDRDRQSDYSLFPAYVMAYEMHKRQKTHDTIATLLSTKIGKQISVTTAKRYVGYGKLLLGGRSYQIGAR